MSEVRLVPMTVGQVDWLVSHAADGDVAMALADAYADGITEQEAELLDRCISVAVGESLAGVREMDIGAKFDAAFNREESK